jgi:hypothetical protein
VGQVQADLGVHRELERQVRHDLDRLRQDRPDLVLVDVGDDRDVNVADDLYVWATAALAGASEVERLYSSAPAALSTNSSPSPM